MTRLKPNMRPFASTLSTIASSPIHPLDVDLDRDGFMTELLRDRATASVMSRGEERAAVARIAALRERAWAALLAAPPLVSAIVELTRQLLGVRLLADEEREAVLLARPGGEAAERAAASASLAAALADIDRGDLVLRRLLAALEAIVAGRPDALPLDRRAHPEVTDLCAALRRDHLAVEAAKGDLFRASLGLVAPIARRFVGGGLPFPALLEAGDAGLMQAVSRYDHRCELRFAVVATWWIRHAISRALAPHMHQGVH